MVEETNISSKDIKVEILVVPLEECVEASEVTVDITVVLVVTVEPDIVT